jgi:hypothetical protein
MNLRCILPFRSANGLPLPEGYPFPSVGDNCTSIGQWMQNNKLYYQLEGYPEICGYNAECFAILPDDTADEVDAQQQEAIIYQR